MASQDKRTGRWEASWYANGKRRKKGGFSSKKNAELYEAQQKIKAEKSMLGYPDISELTVKELFDQYLSWACKNKRPRPAKLDAIILQFWTRFFEQRGIFFVRQITNKTPIEFLHWRTGRPTGDPPSNRTVNRDLSTFRRVFNWATQNGIISSNPVLVLPLFKMPKPDMPRYLSKEEVDLIEKVCEKYNPRLLPAVSVLVRTGMRSGELCALSVNNIDMERSRIILRSSQTKAARSRIVPMAAKVKEIIQNQLIDAKKAGREYIFSTRNGKPLEVTRLNRRFKNLLKAAVKQGLKDVEDVTIHTLRRTYISHMIMAGADPVKVMAIVGHQDWSTIKIYLALSEKYIQDNSDILPF